MYFKEPACTFYEIHLYKSETGQWKTVYQLLEGLFKACPKAVFSQGSLFWMEDCDCEDREKQNFRIVRLDLEDQQLHIVPVPACPFHEDLCQIAPVNTCHFLKNAWCPQVWTLKGCDGNLVAVHYFEDTGDICVWRLVASPEGWKCYLEEGAHFENPLGTNPCFLSVERNRKGCWLWTRTKWLFIAGNWQREEVAIKNVKYVGRVAAI